jgi:transcriptional regulator with XRE-family HTH domain
MAETAQIGKNISKLRELRGFKQDYMATELGISQQQVSKIEQTGKVDDELLRRIAGVLGVTAEGIKNFNEDAVFNIIGNEYHDHATTLNYQCTINPIEKLIELFEENKKLYVQLLESEKEKVAMLRQSKN